MSTLTANAIETNSLQAESGTGEIALPTGHKIVAADAGAFEQPSSPGQIIEVLAGVCDGRSVTVKSGTYTFPNVTAVLQLTTSYQDVTGSEMTYTPPSGTTTVVYKFIWQIDCTGYSGISHYRFYIDTDEVIPAYRSIAPGEYVSSAQHNAPEVFEWMIQCNAASSSPTYGKFTSWTSAKTLKLQAREYDGSSYQQALHQNVWRDGGGASAPYNLAVPVLTITAIA